jgi:hypothetical protein
LEIIQREWKANQLCLEKVEKNAKNLQAQVNSHGTKAQSMRISTGSREYYQALNYGEIRIKGVGCFFFF